MGHNKFLNRSNQFNNNNEVVSNIHVYGQEAIQEKVDTNVLTTMGTVEAARLHVRKEPIAGSESLTIIDRDAKVTIDLNGTEPGNDFYKVKTSEGIEGYCMKKFIKI